MGSPRAFYFISCLSFREWHDLSSHLSARPLISNFLLVWCLKRTTFLMKIYLPVVFIMTRFAVDVLKRLLSPGYLVEYFMLNFDLLTPQSLRQSVVKEFCSNFSLRALELGITLCRQLGANCRRIVLS